MSRSRKPASQPNVALSPASSDLAALPAQVARMRELILDAVEQDDIETLRPAIERNETLPILGSGAERPRTFADAVDHLKRRAFDAQGRETLRLIGAILAAPYVVERRGATTTYVWPAFALVPPAPDDVEAQAALYGCVRFAHVAAGIDPPPVERIGIGADGTWHYFWSGPVKAPR